MHVLYTEVRYSIAASYCLECAYTYCTQSITLTYKHIVLTNSLIVNVFALRFLAWARGRDHVKVTSWPVPGDILPEGYTGQLYDVRVHSRGPDDEVYDHNRDIREKVSILSLEHYRQPLLNGSDIQQNKE